MRNLSEPTFSVARFTPKIFPTGPLLDQSLRPELPRSARPLSPRSHSGRLLRNLWGAGTIGDRCMYGSSLLPTLRVGCFGVTPSWRRRSPWKKPLSDSASPSMSFGESSARSGSMSALSETDQRSDIKPTRSKNSPAPSAGHPILRSNSAPGDGSDSLLIPVDFSLDDSGESARPDSSTRPTQAGRQEKARPPSIREAPTKSSSSPPTSQNPTPGCGSIKPPAVPTARAVEDRGR